MPEALRLAIRLHSGMAVPRAIELGKLAEQCGFHTVWFAENPFERGVLPTLSVIASATRTLRLGLGVVNPFNRHPTLMAMEAGTLAELAPGRIVLGIGSGIAEAVARMGFSYDRPVSAVADATRIARGMLSGDTVSHDGSVFKVNSVRLGYQVTRSPVPIFLAAMGDRALRIVGELGDGLLIGNMCPSAYTARALTQLAAGARAAGRDPATIELVKYVPCAIGPDARDVVKNAIGRLLGSYWELYKDVPKVRAAIREGNQIEPQRFARAVDRVIAGEQGAAVLGDDFVSTYAVAGELHECVEQCLALHRSGVTEVALSFVGHDPAAEMRRFAEALRS
jgi:5,10-methylenetetrahydromethanopterin reductase